MKADFFIPKEFQDCCQSLRKKKTITEREYVDLCLPAVKLSKTRREKRQGMACYLAGLWLQHKNIAADDLLEQIGNEFGRLELPDHHVAGSEEGVHKRWEEVGELIQEADRTFK